MNTKDRRNYRRHQNAALKAINKARNALAEMDALTHNQPDQLPKLLHANVRDLRDLLGTTYSMALGIRVELWDFKGPLVHKAHKPS